MIVNRQQQRDPDQCYPIIVSRLVRCKNQRTLPTFVQLKYSIPVRGSWENETHQKKKETVKLLTNFEVP